MPTTSALEESFAAGLGRPESELPADLRESLAARIESARAAWPELDVSPHAFAQHLGKLLTRSPGSELAAGLDKLRGPDLWLAYACMLGEPRALRILEERHLASAARAVARFGDPHGFVADALQELRQRLLVGTPPRIGTYNGSGSLESWIKVAAVRVAINLRSSEKSRAVGTAQADELDEGLARVEDPELDYIKAQYRGDFASALRDAFSDLSTDERSMLRFYLIDRLNIAEIGGLFGVSRATVGRRIVDAREKVLEGTRSRLKARLGVPSVEVDSLIAALQSRIELSLSQVLGKRG